jgi:hypothetical protein
MTRPLGRVPVEASFRLIELNDLQQDHPHGVKHVEHAVQRCLIGERAAEHRDGLATAKPGEQIKVAQPLAVARIQMSFHPNFVS